MKKGKKFLSNRLAYTLIAIGILLVVAIGVYAVGAVPNPGHPISQLQTCDSNGQTLVMSNGAWTCGTSQSVCPSGFALRYNYAYTYNEQQSTSGFNYDGDEYRTPADTCDGNKNENAGNSPPGPYTCYQGQSGSCVDVWDCLSGAGWCHDTVTCTEAVTETTATPYCGNP
jgi:hypothetical protein